MAITSIIFLGVIAIGIGIILPSVRYINTMKQEIEHTEAQLEEQYQKIKLLKRSINEIEEIKQNTKKFYSITMGKGNELQLIEQLEQLATTHHVAQNLGVSYNDNIYTFSFKINGEFTDVMNYLQSLEQFPYYINISAIGLNKSGENVSLSFSGDVYSTK